MAFIMGHCCSESSEVLHIVHGRHVAGGDLQCEVSFAHRRREMLRHLHIATIRCSHCQELRALRLPLGSTSMRVRSRSLVFW